MKNTLLSNRGAGFQPILGTLTLAALLIGLAVQPVAAQTKTSGGGTWPGSWSADTHLPQTNPAPQAQQEKALLDQCGVAFKAQQYDRALSLCKQAAATGDKEAIEGLAIIYRDGLGQCSQAAPYYKANKDSRPAAASGLGEMYWLGCRDFPQDIHQARALLESAANRGFINALEDLAWMDELGQGAPHDRPKAIQELRTVARQTKDEWTNDTIIALTQANAPPRFNSAQQLGSYIADVRFARGLAAYNQEEASRPRSRAGGVVFCVAGNPAIPGNQGWCRIR